MPQSPADRPLTLPAVVKPWAGRDDLLALLGERLAADAGPPVLLWGMGGVGKSVLAVRTAADAADRFPGGVLFVALGGWSDRPATPAEAMRAVVRGLRPSVEPPEDERELAGRYRDLLNRGRRLLVVFDDVRDAAQVAPLIDLTRPPALLLTSRGPLEHFADAVERVPVDLFTLAESSDLLDKLAPGRADDIQRTALAGRCGLLPLAVRVAGWLLRQWGQTAVQLLADLADEAGRLATLTGPTPDTDVAAVLRLGVADLPADWLEWYRELTVFAGDFDTAAAAAVWDTPVPERLLNKLLDLGLVQEAVNGRWGLHDLLRPVAREAADGDLNPAARRHAEHYLKGCDTTAVTTRRRR